MPNSSKQTPFLLLPENRSADRALQKIVADPGTVKPKRLFLYGPTGVGKSHLLAQTHREARSRFPKLKSDHLTASEFAAQLADASDQGTIPEFQTKFRTLDVLICEDLQSLQKRKESQRQLIRCLDELESKGAIVVLSSTTLPGSWQGVDRRLVDRCRGGLSLEIPLPGAGSRKKLVSHFAQALHQPMTASIATLIAQTVSESPRDLKSAVTRLVEDAHRRQQQLTKTYVTKFLEGELSAPEVPMKKIVHTTAKYFGLKVGDLKSSSRRADIVYARQTCMYLLREMTSLTQKEIAKGLGKADHTSVVRAYQKIEGFIEKDSRVRHEILELKSALSTT
ncbi:MAG: ATP-binding protein [Planctomycetaceae bacterium]|nr:ATP-binding protein [Planctomycetaceae bacterium]